MKKQITPQPKQKTKSEVTEKLLNASKSRLGDPHKDLKRKSIIQTAGEKE